MTWSRLKEGASLHGLFDTLHAYEPPPPNNTLIPHRRLQCDRQTDRQTAGRNSRYHKLTDWAPAPAGVNSTCICYQFQTNWMLFYSNTTVYYGIHKRSECILVDSGVTNLIHDRRSCVDLFFTLEVRRTCSMCPLKREQARRETQQWVMRRLPTADSIVEIGRKSRSWIKLKRLGRNRRLVSRGQVEGVPTYTHNNAAFSVSFPNVRSHRIRCVAASQCGATHACRPIQQRIQRDCVDVRHRAATQAVWINL